MRRSVLLVGSLLVLGGLSAVAAREVSVRASQPLTPESDFVAIDVMERADQSASPECAQLTRLALQAEVNALGVQLAHQSQSPALDQNISELSATLVQLRSFAFNGEKVEQLRAQYTNLLQTLLQAAQSEQALTVQLTQKAQAVSDFNREQILFEGCQVTDL